MKLATIKNGRRDGQLVLVNRALTHMTSAADIVATLQQALDDWEHFAPKLQERFQQLEDGHIASLWVFDLQQVLAPLPRAYQWCDGSAYLSHAELVRRARNAEMPAFLYEDPLMYQGAGDTLCGPVDPIRLADEAWGIDLEAEVAIVTDDVPMGLQKADALKHIRLVTIVNDVSLRNLIPHELSKGFGFFHSKPSTAFAAVMVTPDELGTSWDGAKVSLPLISKVNGKELGRPNAGVDLNFDFGDLVAYAAKTRNLGAGTVIGSGTVSNRNPAVGSSCLAERRMIEIIDKGSASTPYLAFGDTVEIEMHDQNGRSVFGPIRQKVERYIDQHSA